MFPIIIANDYASHVDRQRDLQENAQAERLSSLFVKESKIIIIRKRVGMILIVLGQKLAEQSASDARLVLSTPTP